MMIFTIIVTSLALLVGIGSTFFLGDDNPIEEIAEEIIEKTTGLEIDLSPGTEELQEIREIHVI